MKKLHYKAALFYIIIALFILFSHTFAFAQYEGVQGVQLTDGSIVYGKITKIDADDIRIETKEGKKISVKCDKVKNFIIMDFFRGIQFKDGSTIYGNVVEMDLNKVVIMTKDNEAVTRKFSDISSFIQEYEAKNSKHHLAVGTEISYFKYEEPGYMKDTGIMYGIVGSYAYHNKLMTKLEGKFAYGLVDYDGEYQDGTPLKISGISDYLLELRWLLGYDFVVARSITITPDFGVGYRYLQDNMQDRSSAGYQRESNYIYIPIGVETVAHLGRGWSLGLNVEYDLFLWGRQISYLSDFNPNYGEIENEQMKGYGVRGSISIAKKWEKIGLTIEPFIRYWNIKESRQGNITYDGVIVGYGIEPNNDSTEIGGKLAVTF